MGNLHVWSVFTLALISTVAATRFPIHSGSAGTQQLCGTCPEGYQRESHRGPYCGKCLPIQTSCQDNYYLQGTHCLPCPCKHASGCTRSDSGQFTCHCLPNYSGNNCEECAQGCRPNPQYPDECVRITGSDPVVPPFCEGSRCPRVKPTLCPGCSCQGHGCSCDTCHIHNPPVYVPPVGIPALCPPCHHQHHHCPPCNYHCSSVTSCQNTCNTCPHQHCQCPPPCPTCCRQPTVCPESPACPENRCPSIPPCPENRCPSIPPCPKCPDIDLNVTTTTIVELISNLALELTCETAIYDQPPPPRCDCDECDSRGTDRIISGIHDEERMNIIKHGQFCVCKTNVEGAKCNQCKPGYFGLHAVNTRGCSSCFCSGVSLQCNSAELFVDYIEISEDVRRISVVKLENGFVESQEVDRVSSRDSTISFKLSYGEDKGTHYWRLPEVFCGNKVTSYSGVLEFTRSFTPPKYFSSSELTAGVNDVIIVSTHGMSLYWGSSDANTTNTTFQVTLDDQSGWLSSRQNYTRVADRRDIMEVLVDIQYIYIRASKQDSRESELSDVKLSFGTKDTRDTNLGLVTSVEHCACPEGYTGFSCENCSPGYKRDFDDLAHGIFGRCVKNVEKALCETLTVSLTPLSCKDCYNELRTFTCSYSLPGHDLKIYLRTEPEWETLLQKNRHVIEAQSRVVYPGKQIGNSRNITIPVLKQLERVICDVRSENSNDIEVQARVKVHGKQCTVPFIPPPLLVEVSPEFICMYTNETRTIKCTAVLSPLSHHEPRLTWYKEGPNVSSIVLDNQVGTFILSKPEVSASGTYVCSIFDGSSLSHKKVNVVVREPCDDPTKPTDNNSMQCVIHKPQQLNRATSLDIQADDPINNEIKVDEINVANFDLFPTVHAYPVHLEVDVGKPASFFCKANRASTVFWEAESGQFSPFVSTSGVLELHGVRKSDEGEYVCIAQNEHGDAKTKVSLTVIEKEFEVRIDSSPPSFQATVAHPMILTCESHEEVIEFKWSKLDGSLPRHSVQYPNGSLVISSMEESDDGVYVCAAESSHGEKTESRTTVQFSKKRDENFVKPEHFVKPEVQLMKSPYYAKKGENIRIPCHVIGEPSPILTWSFTQENDSGIFEKVLSVQNQRASIFEIESINDTQEGNYTCEAKNVVGQDKKTLEIFVDYIEFKCNYNTEFKCKNNLECILKEKICDGKFDCKDESDEAHYMCQREHRHRHGHGENKNNALL
ncbi:unnamed protein product [Allacma fusca]|uniref:Basement membrane-specific heparan sulfate proteoglycan core protein n=1 Tax=Allacma fusca TaxID=39272 RepID=A0A8J2K319_9HEXA|nr:unnamed protein product [Allacma fusca]